VITVTREPTGAEQAQCKRNGVELAAPMQTASDAIVLATKNASDVGGDCITVRQGRDIFKAGSTYSNWSQLGFDNLPLRTVGRNQGSDSFQLFGQVVLGIANPTLGDVRADYLARPSDRTERETVTGAAVRRAAEARIARHARFLKTSTRAALPAQSAAQQTSSSMPSGSRKKRDHSLPRRWTSPTSWAPASSRRGLRRSRVALESTERAKWSMAPRPP